MNGTRIVAGVAAGLCCLSTAHADCLDDAAAYQHVSSQLVHAIAQQESGMRASAINVNGDGSQDIGLMQINSSWLPKLSRYGVRREHLFNACVNAYV
ncbi:Invasion protein iagB, putative, partial [Ricinus communis]